MSVAESPGDTARHEAHEDAELHKAMDALRAAMATRVRQEQRRNQLTRLPNLVALQDALAAALDQEADSHWVAFVEVDYFKQINDRFGYENTDQMLQGVAQCLRDGGPCFPGSTVAYHAHGDEFYLLGAVKERELSPRMLEAIQKDLDDARAAIAALRINVEHRGQMSCTVSIGWLDVKRGGSASPRSILVDLERAVAEAKKKRNAVHRFDPEAPTVDLVSLRAQCTGCGTRIIAEVPRNKNERDERLRCPNCKVDVERPPEPVPLANSGASDVPYIPPARGGEPPTTAE